MGQLVSPKLCTVGPQGPTVVILWGQTWCWLAWVPLSGRSCPWPCSGGPRLGSPSRCPLSALFFRCCSGASITFSVWPPTRPLPLLLSPCCGLPSLRPPRPPPPASFGMPGVCFWQESAGAVSRQLGTVEPRRVRDSRDRSVRVLAGRHPSAGTGGAQGPGWRWRCWPEALAWLGLCGRGCVGL